MHSIKYLPVCSVLSLGEKSSSIDFCSSLFTIKNDARESREKKLPMGIIRNNAFLKCKNASKRHLKAAKQVNCSSITYVQTIFSVCIVK